MQMIQVRVLDCPVLAGPLACCFMFTRGMSRSFADGWIALPQNVSIIGKILYLPLISILGTHVPLVKWNSFRIRVLIELSNWNCQHHALLMLLIFLCNYYLFSWKYILSLKKGPDLLLCIWDTINIRVDLDFIRFWLDPPNFRLSYYEQSLRDRPTTGQW